MKFDITSGGAETTENAGGGDIVHEVASPGGLHVTTPAGTVANVGAVPAWQVDPEGQVAGMLVPEQPRGVMTTACTQQAK